MYGYESWTIKKVESWRMDAFEQWCWRNLESPLDSKEIKPVNPIGNQSCPFIGRTGAEAEAPILWPLKAKNWLIRKDPDDGKDWGREEKGKAEDEMVGWHHRLNGHEFEQTPGVCDGKRSLACCSPRGHKEWLMGMWLSDWTEVNWGRTHLRTALVWGRGGVTERRQSNNRGEGHSFPRHNLSSAPCVLGTSVLGLDHLRLWLSFSSLYHQITKIPKIPKVPKITPIASSCSFTSSFIQYVSFALCVPGRIQ